LKKNQREIINIIALVIILVIAFNISNLFNESIKEENNLRNTQNAHSTTTTDEAELEVEEPEEATYDSEQYTDLIVNDLASSEEEISFSPKVAFIIDDLGYETEVAKKISILNLLQKKAEKIIRKLCYIYRWSLIILMLTPDLV